MDMIFELYKVKTKTSIRHHQNVKLSKEKLVPNGTEIEFKIIKL